MWYNARQPKHKAGVFQVISILSFSKLTCNNRKMKENKYGLIFSRTKKGTLYIGGVENFRPWKTFGSSKLESTSLSLSRGVLNLICALQWVGIRVVFSCHIQCKSFTSELPSGVHNWLNHFAAQRRAGNHIACAADWKRQGFFFVARQRIK